MKDFQINSTFLTLVNFVIISVFYLSWLYIVCIISYIKVCIYHKKSLDLFTGNFLLWVVNLLSDLSSDIKPSGLFQPKLTGEVVWKFRHTQHPIYFHLILLCIKIMPSVLNGRLKKQRTGWSLPMAQAAEGNCKIQQTHNACRFTHFSFSYQWKNYYSRTVLFWAVVQKRAVLNTVTFWCLVSCCVSYN